MGPETSSKETIPKTSDKTELTSLCSCNGCETVRCYSTKKPMNDTDDDEKFSKTCIYFTNITIKKSNSKTDTSARDTTDTSNNRMPSCEICRKEREMKNSKNGSSLPKSNTNNTAGVGKGNVQDNASKVNTKNPLCKICKKNIQNIGDMVERNCISPKNEHVINLTAKGKSSNVRELNKKESEFNDKRSTPIEIINKLISEWEICKQNMIKDAATNKSSVLDTKSSMCEVCLRNINKLNNDVDTFNKGLVSEVYKFNTNINNLAEPNFILPVNKHTSKSKCLINIQPKCSTCAIKYGTSPKQNLIVTKTPCKQEKQIKGETCGTNNKITERICKKQSNCKICGRYANITRQFEKSLNRKSQQPYIADNEYNPKNKESYIKLFQTSVLTPTKNHSKCSNCEKKDLEVYGKIDDNGKIGCHKMNNEADFRSNCRETNSGCFTKLQRKSPINSANSFILCTCKNHENYKQNNLKHTHDCRVINVHNATVNYKYDINQSAAKLSAQIMNVPYEDFQESFSHADQDNIITKTKMKNNLSEEIIKRIKDVYKACSCKICECIAGKSLKFDNECNCKPCNCDDCKSYKNDIFAVSRNESKIVCTHTNCPAEICHDVTRKIQNQYCKCTPCDCFKCMPPRTFITARVSENSPANNCSCTPCRCLECERNYFPRSSHLTHDMSTGTVRNCGCDQCLDQRCRGAGGTEDCRCEMPSKAIFKPVEKDSHEYDIRRTSVCHQRNMKKRDNFDTIAMYASVSSNFAPLGTLKEACSCEECECFACKNEDGKLSIETILKPQLKLNAQSIKKNNCVCKSCECEVCSYNKDIPECEIQYQDAECACDECYCINCQTMVKSSTTIKEAKPIGKIYYKNSFSGGSQHCDDFDLTTSGSSRTYGNKQGHHVCMNAALDKTCYLKNSDCDPLQLFDYYNRHIGQYQNEDADTCSLTKTFCDIQDVEDKQRPVRDSPMFYKESQDDFSVKIKQFNKDSNKFSNTYKDNVVKSDKKCQENVGKKKKKNLNKYLQDSEYSWFGTNKIMGHDEIEQSQCPLSNCKTNCSKSTLHSCLKDIFKFNEDFNLNSLKFAHNLNESKTMYPPHTYESEGCRGNRKDSKPFPSLHQRENISIESNVCNKHYTNDSILDMPLVKNSNKLNLPNNQIDYERVHKTLKEAKDFSGQLIKLLEKYDRANKEFQSVSEKLKLSHGLNVLSKLASVQLILIEETESVHDTHGNPIDEKISGENDTETKLRHHNAIDDLKDISDLMSTHEKCIQRKKFTFQNIVNEENGRKNNIEKKLCYHLAPIDDLKDISDLMSTHENSIRRKYPNDSNNEMSYFGDKVQKDMESSEIMQSKENSDLMESQKTIESTVVAKDNINEQSKMKIEESKMQSLHKNIDTENISLNIEEKSNTNQLNEFKEIPSLANNTKNSIDSLTNQLSNMIMENNFKKYEEIIFSRDVKKYEKFVSVSDNSEVLQENKINNNQDWSISKKNYYLSHNQDIKDSFTSPILEVPKLQVQSMYVQTSMKHIDEINVEKVVRVKSAFSVPRNKTIQVEKEIGTHCGAMEDQPLFKNNDQRTSSKNILKSWTEFDFKQQPQFSVAHCSRPCEFSLSPRTKCSCEDFKVSSLSGRRVSDHTVMVKWTNPKDTEGVQGYELLVDGRPVQKIIDPARCMAVVTCLPNCEKVLLTMRTVLEVPLRSGHKPTVTIIYWPRLKKNKNNEVKQEIH